MLKLIFCQKSDVLIPSTLHGKKCDDVYETKHGLNLIIEEIR